MYELRIQGVGQEINGESYMMMFQCTLSSLKSVVNFFYLCFSVLFFIFCSFIRLSLSLCLCLFVSFSLFIITYLKFVLFLHLFLCSLLFFPLFLHIYWHGISSLTCQLKEWLCLYCSQQSCWRIHPDESEAFSSVCSSPRYNIFIRELCRWCIPSCAI